MADSFFFYDLETTGFDVRQGRIMQFAGQRTDRDLQPIGEPVNVMIKLTPDILPSPDAILITGITPQQTIAEGLTEAQFLRLFYEEVVARDTIFLGFNSVRFDDEFMRFLHYRNFYDPYEWHWRDNCSRWDLLDLIRMTRALRPEGIVWPFAPDGKPANRLELLTSVNKLDHTKAHDALNDVYATISIAQLVREKQKDLFEYLLGMRDKKKVAQLVQTGKPFVYSSGRYPSEYVHTTAVVLLAQHPQSGASLVYDLRYDPTPFLGMNTDQLIAAWRFTKDTEALRLPVKTVKYNRCPAVAPLGVIKQAQTQQRIDLSLETIARHLTILKKHQATFGAKLLKAVKRLDQERAQQTSLIDNQLTVDARLYEGFFSSQDKHAMRVVQTAAPEKLSEMLGNFTDERLKNLLPLYKARNYPDRLSSEEQLSWENFCRQQLFEGGAASRLAKYFDRLNELSDTKLISQQQYLLEELQLYGQSIVPSDEDEFADDEASDAS